MKLYVILFCFIALVFCDVVASEAQASGSLLSRTYCQPPTRVNYPGITCKAAPYRTVSCGLYKTGHHGGYYGPRNGGPLPQQ